VDHPRVSVEAGVEVGYLAGRDEARLTFLAVRAWYGWSAGPLLLLKNHADRS
jgi:exopolyphosphatase/guanosine-5'-triphosphate,3'-diphosphate pyrophosphatase